MNREAMLAFGKMVDAALTRNKIRMYTAAQNLGVSSSYVSSVKEGNFNPNDIEIEKLAEFLGLPLKLVDACKRPPRAIVQIDDSTKTVSNVVKLEEFKKNRSWLTTDIFPKG